MSTITTNDATQIYYKDWDEREPVVFRNSAQGSGPSVEFVWNGRF